MQDRPIRDCDFAVFLRLALMSKLLDYRAVLKWAEVVIGERDSPPPCFFELVYATEHSTKDLLKEVNGDPNFEFAIDLLIGLVCRYHRSQMIASEAVCYLAYDLCSNRDGVDRLGEWADMLGWLDLRSQLGWPLPKPLEQFVNDRLTPYTRFETMIPSWLPLPPPIVAWSGFKHQMFPLDMDCRFDQEIAYKWKS